MLLQRSIKWRQMGGQEVRGMPCEQDLTPLLLVLKMGGARSEGTRTRSPELLDAGKGKKHILPQSLHKGPLPCRHHIFALGDPDRLPPSRTVRHICLVLGQ